MVARTRAIEFITHHNVNHCWYTIADFTWSIDLTAVDSLLITDSTQDTELDISYAHKHRTARGTAKISRK